MTQTTVKLQIPLSALVEALSLLEIEEKRKLWQLLDEQIALAEEELWEQHPIVQAEIQQASTAYQTTVTIMQLAETGFQEWNDPEEDIYNDEA